MGVGGGEGGKAAASAERGEKKMRDRKQGVVGAAPH